MKICVLGSNFYPIFAEEMEVDVLNFLIRWFNKLIIVNFIYYFDHYLLSLQRVKNSINKHEFYAGIILELFPQGRQMNQFRLWKLETDLGKWL